MESTLKRAEIFGSLWITCILLGTILGVLAGLLLGLWPYFLVGFFVYAPFGGIVGLSAGGLAGLIAGLVTIRFFYPSLNRQAYPIFMTLNCVGCTLLSVTLVAIGGNYFRVNDHWTTESYAYDYLVPMAVAALISRLVSYVMVARYVRLSDTGGIHHDMTQGSPQGSTAGVAIGLIVCLLGVTVALGLSWSVMRPMALSSHFEIPQGYIGWVEVDFDQAGGIPLGNQNEHPLFQIPATGLLKTSSMLAYESFQDTLPSAEYYYHDDIEGLDQTLHKTAPGQGGMIWGEATSSEVWDSKQVAVFRFFVGTQAQYDKYAVIAKATVGPIKP